MTEGSGSVPLPNRPGRPSNIRILSTVSGSATLIIRKMISHDKDGLARGPHLLVEDPGYGELAGLPVPPRLMLGRERLVHLVPDRGLKYANDYGGLSGLRFINFKSFRRWAFYESIKLTSTRNDEDLLDQFRLFGTVRAGYSSRTRNFMKFKFKKETVLKAGLGFWWRKGIDLGQIKHRT